MISLLKHSFVAQTGTSDTGIMQTTLIGYTRTEIERLKAIGWALVRREINCAEFDRRLRRLQAERQQRMDCAAAELLATVNLGD